MLCPASFRLEAARLKPISFLPFSLLHGGHMTVAALAKLQHRSERLTAKLNSGTATEISAARELLRQSLVELYEKGYWREQPQQLKQHMRLFRACEATRFNAPASMSGPDRMDRYTP